MKLSEDTKCDIAILAFVAICIIILFAMSSCRSVHQVVMPERTDSVRVRTEYRTDTLLRDKVRLVYVQGDTVRITDSVTIERVRVQIRADTIKRIDSIAYPVEVRVTEYRRSGYDKFCSVAFWMMAGIIGLVLGIKIYRLRF